MRLSVTPMKTLTCWKEGETNKILTDVHIREQGLLKLLD